MLTLGISIAFVGLALANYISVDAATISAISVAYDVTDYSSSGRGIANARSLLWFSRAAR
jgi:hypothetical protein